MTIHEIINARAAAHWAGSWQMWLNRINRNCWRGFCEEIMEALESRKHHRVYHTPWGRVIFREGYTAPHFVQVGHSFINPFWNKA